MVSPLLQAQYDTIKSLRESTVDTMLTRQTVITKDVLVTTHKMCSHPGKVNARNTITPVSPINICYFRVTWEQARHLKWLEHSALPARGPESIHGTSQPPALPGVTPKTQSRESPECCLCASCTPPRLPDKSLPCTEMWFYQNVSKN